MTRQRALLILAFVAIVIGCGAQKQGALDNSSRAMADAGSSRIQMTMTQGKDTFFVGVGAFDYRRNRGQIELRGSGKPFSGEVFESRFIGRTTYLRWPLRGTKRWQKESDFDPSGPDRFIPGPGGPSPERVLDLLFKSSKEVEVLGNDEIRGVSAKHYRAHIDQKKLDEIGDYGGDLVVDAWIDDEGLVRRLRLPEPYPDANATTRVDLFDFGVKVEVKAPPDNEIITEQEFEDLIFKQCKTMEPGDNSPTVCMVFSGGGTSSSKVTVTP